jgi:hypothetical protein
MVILMEQQLLDLIKKQIDCGGFEKDIVEIIKVLEASPLYLYSIVLKDRIFNHKTILPPNTFKTRQQAEKALVKAKSQIIQNVTAYPFPCIWLSKKLCLEKKFSNEFELFDTNDYTVKSTLQIQIENVIGKVLD